MDGRFLGIGAGTSLADASRVLGVAPISGTDDAYTQTTSPLVVPACLSGGPQWAIYTGGLRLFFEGDSPDTAFVTNWNYTGGPVAGYTEMVGADGVAIGDTRQDLVAAYPSLTDYGDEVFVPGFRFGLDGDRIVWLGEVDCAMEGE